MTVARPEVLRDGGGPQLGQIKLGETDLDGVLTQISELAKRAIASPEEVSVTLVSGKDPHSAAFTGELALTLDEFQYQYCRGPCLDASVSHAILSVPDMTVETRWPQWAARCIDTGARSSLSVGLPVHETVTGAINIYATTPGAFDDDAVTLGQTFAGYAAVALADAHLYDTQAAWPSTCKPRWKAAPSSKGPIRRWAGVRSSPGRAPPRFRSPCGR